MNPKCVTGTELQNVISMNIENKGEIFSFLVRIYA